MRSNGSRRGRRGYPAQRAGGAVYAAIDLGTNNCRMLAARPAPDGFRVVDSFSRIVRLGEGLAASGELGEGAIGRTLEALAVCAEKMRARQASRVRNVATEACRRAANSEQFLSRVKAETGLTLEPIAAAEEARLTLAGCAPLLRTGRPRALVFDIGGGSTEVMWIEKPDAGPPRLLGLRSLGSGVVTLAEGYRGGNLAAGDYAAIAEGIDDQLAAFDAEHGIAGEIAGDRVQMVGAAGTVTTLGAVHLGLPRYRRDRVDGLEIGFGAIAAACADIAGMDYPARVAHPCIGRERADLVVVGCAILEAICRRWPVGRLRIADRGVREGLLLGMMAADGAGPFGGPAPAWRFAAGGPPPAPR